MKMKEEHRTFLNDLRDSGETNMFGAGVYLQEFFGMTQKESKEVLLEWMESFKKEKN